MCQYSLLGIIIFQVLPPIIIGGILSFVLVKFIKIGKLNLAWKIVSIILALILTFISWVWLEESKTMYSFDSKGIFSGVKVWSCDDTLFNGISVRSSAVPTVFTYHDLRVPVKLDESSVTASLMEKKSVLVKQDICAQTIAMAKEDGWQILDTQSMTDGGSKGYSLFQNKDVPAVDIYCNYEMSSGKYESTNISFIHPAQIGTWLLKMNSDPARELGYKPAINVEELMGCDGTIIAGRNAGMVECFKK